MTNLQEIETALRQYFTRLDESAQKRILPGWTRPCGRGCGEKRPRQEATSDQNESSYERSDPETEDLNRHIRKAWRFLNSRQSERARADKTAKKSTVDYEVVRGAISAVQKGYTWTQETDVEKIWSIDGSANTSQEFNSSSDLHRLSLLYKKVVSSTHGSECKRRILALLYHHECRRHRISIGKKGTGASSDS